LKYFLDTNICIYFLKGLYPDIKQRISRQKPADIKIPSIVYAELLYGIEKSLQKDKNLKALKLFIEPLQIVSFNEKSSETYSIIRNETEKSGKNVGGNDLLIASIVLANKGTLITNN